VARTLHESLWQCCTRYCIICYLSYTFPGTNVVAQVGLVLQDNETRMDLAYNLYTSTSPRDEAIALEFKKKYCCPVPIEFLGVWCVLNLLQLNLD